ncbi:hypothetical protein CPB86DRAFT_799530 [Serendipita vermifera]|nr:hypothetical protein CPB86DRAFT_799530 [Serendipita vermifera]
MKRAARMEESTAHEILFGSIFLSVQLQNAFGKLGAAVTGIIGQAVHFGYCLAERGVPGIVLFSELMRDYRQNHRVLRLLDDSLAGHQLLLLYAECLLTSSKAEGRACGIDADGNPTCGGHPGYDVEVAHLSMGRVPPTTAPTKGTESTSGPETTEGASTDMMEPIDPIGATLNGPSKTPTRLTTSSSTTRGVANTSPDGANSTTSGAIVEDLVTVFTLLAVFLS